MFNGDGNWNIHSGIKMKEKELIIIISAVVLIALFGGVFSFGMMGNYGIGNMMHNYYGANNLGFKTN